MTSGSDPAIWTTPGRSSSERRASWSVRSCPRTMPSAITISVAVRPQPRRRAMRRNAMFVNPAIGARKRGGSITSLPSRRGPGPPVRPRESIGPASDGGPGDGAWSALGSIGFSGCGRMSHGRRHRPRGGHARRGSGSWERRVPGDVGCPRSRDPDVSGTERTRLCPTLADPLTVSRRRGRRPGAPAGRWVLWLAMAVAVLPSPAARAGETRPPTDGERVSYWLDRVLRGPEPTAFAIPNFHLALLQDAERNLVELGDATARAPRRRRAARPGSVAARHESVARPPARARDPGTAAPRARACVGRAGARGRGADVATRGAPGPRGAAGPGRRARGGGGVRARRARPRAGPRGHPPADVVRAPLGRRRCARGRRARRRGPPGRDEHGLERPDLGARGAVLDGRETRSARVVGPPRRDLRAPRADGTPRGGRGVAVDRPRAHRRGVPGSRHPLGDVSRGGRARRAGPSRESQRARLRAGRPRRPRPRARGDRREGPRGRPHRGRPQGDDRGGRPIRRRPRGRGSHRDAGPGARAPRSPGPRPERRRDEGDDGPVRRAPPDPDVARSDPVRVPDARPAGCGAGGPGRRPAPGPRRRARRPGAPADPADEAPRLPPAARSVRRASGVRGVAEPRGGAS